MAGQKKRPGAQAFSAEQPSVTDRRSVLKKAATVSAALVGYSILPRQWVKPEVSLMTLPAHAQTSAVQTVKSFSTSSPKPCCSKVTLASAATSSSSINAIFTYVSCGGGSMSVPLAAGQSITVSIKKGSTITAASDPPPNVTDQGFSGVVTGVTIESIGPGQFLHYTTAGCGNGTITVETA